MTRIGQQRDGVCEKTVSRFDDNEAGIECNAYGKSAAKTGRSMGMAGAMRMPGMIVIVMSIMVMFRVIVWHEWFLRQLWLRNDAAAPASDFAPKAMNNAPVKRVINLGCLLNPWRTKARPVQ